MKKSKNILAAIIGVAIVLLAITVELLDKDYVISADSLPLAAKTANLSSHFYSLLDGEPSSRVETEGNILPLLFGTK